MFSKDFSLSKLFLKDQEITSLHKKKRLTPTLSEWTIISYSLNITNVNIGFFTFHPSKSDFRQRGGEVMH